ncbi:hypothetical protein EW026_g6276 [Hermanssonia centrifuga]|uniref:AB hydrolase-1 domain-containing protein n=1 Tax=Hermanssonia centrifuga TaxID=98765 RepID=A0A4V3X9T0_9APHY|nr:hypothetical protein EW026_g6276 [Hermanssonia centrifuga]
MPTAQVNGNGAEIFYEDSGAPPGSTDYATIVIVHGLVFHSGTFKRTLPFAAPNNLRIVAINQRDYPGSTLYTASELDRITSSNVEDLELALQAQGQEFATFLVHLINAGGVLPVQEKDGKKSGGLAVLGWSLGNLVPLCMFGNAKHIEEETKSLLNEYLRTLVIFDSPPFPIGEPIPKEFSFPLWDSTIAPEDRGPCFAIWVGTYFSPAVPDLSSMDIQALESRTNISQTSEPDNMAPTTSRMSVEELQSMTHPEVLERSGGPLMELEPAVYWRVTERALFETDGVFASVDAVAIWCNMSVAPCVWAARRIAERAEAAKTEGKRGRKVDTVKIDGANHFPHWDEPERLVRLLADSI